MKIAIVDRKPARVATRRYVGAFGEPLVKFWRNAVTPWLAENGLVDCPRFGVPLDDPMSAPPDERRYDCCVELPAGLGIADAVESAVPGGRYAVTRFKGTGAQIGAAWEEFVRACLAEGLTRDSAKLAFEHYPRGATLDPKTGVFSCELCFPLAFAISRATRADAVEILDLQKRAYRSEAELYGDETLPPLVQTLESLIEEIGGIVVLKMSDGARIVGSVRARRDDDVCHIGRLIVEPSLQGQGLGKRLLQAIEGEFARTRQFALFTGSRSERNILLYERAGYRRAREQVLSPAVTLVHLEKTR